jgi:hypothetical protein
MMDVVVADQQKPDLKPAAFGHANMMSVHHYIMGFQYIRIIVGLYHSLESGRYGMVWYGTMPK